MVLGQHGVGALFGLHFQAHHCRQEFLCQGDQGCVELLQGWEGLIRRRTFAPQGCREDPLWEQEQATDEETQTYMTKGTPHHHRARCLYHVEASPQALDDQPLCVTAAASSPREL